MMNDKMANISTQSNEEHTNNESNNKIKEPSCSTKPKESKKTEVPPWHIFLRTASDSQITERFAQEVGQLLKDNVEVSHYCCLALLEPEDSIANYELNKIFNALIELNSG